MTPGVVSAGSHLKSKGFTRKRGGGVKRIPSKATPGVTWNWIHMTLESSENSFIRLQSRMKPVSCDSRSRFWRDSFKINTPAPAAYVRTLKEEVLPSFLERRNQKQRTATELLIRHYQYLKEQHSVFTHRVRGKRVWSKRTYRVKDQYRRDYQTSHVELRWIYTYAITYNLY